MSLDNTTLLAYRAARENIAVIPFPNEGHYLISGEDRTAFLQNLMSQDIHQARDGQGIYSTFLTAKGKVLADFNLYPLPDAYFLEVAPAIAEKTVQHLMRFKFRSRVKIEPTHWEKIVVAGPKAKAFLSEQMPLPSEGEQSFHASETDPVLIIQKTYTGENDYALYSREKTFHDELLSAGKCLMPIGPEALEILRVEAGLLRYGAELDENRLPIEAGLEESAISYTKGCYPGQEVIARIKTYGHVNWRLGGLILKEETFIPQPRDPIFNGEAEIGWITSGVYSPFHKAPIVLAYLRVGAAEQGASVAVLSGSTRANAVVAEIPFYKAGA